MNKTDLIKKRTEYLAENLAAGGVVIINKQGEPCGWSYAVRAPHLWEPGCIAVEENGSCWIANGGNNYEGATYWQLITDEPEQAQPQDRIEELENALAIALPFVEEAKSEVGYKPGYVEKTIRKLIDTKTGKTEPRGCWIPEPLINSMSTDELRSELQRPLNYMTLQLVARRLLELAERAQNRGAA